MSEKNNHQSILFVYGLLLSLISGVILVGYLSSPSEAGSAILFGLSPPRILLALGTSAAFVFFSLITIRSARDRVWAEKKIEGWFGKGPFSRILAWLSWIGFGLGWTGVFAPSYNLGEYEGYWIRIQPVMWFTLLAGVATLTLFYIQRRNSPVITNSNSRVIHISMILFLICLFPLTGMLYSKFGIHSLDDFWYGAGVPILVPQLIVAMVAGLLFLQIEKKWIFERFDLIVFILILAVTAFLWAHEPLVKGFSFVGPYPPNNALYPLYDADIFDTASQFPLIGQRLFIFGGYFFERPLYLAFLVYLHALFGQDYELLMAVQAAIFAIFPGLIYFIGRSLNMRAVGFAAAIVAMFRGINAIAASNLIDLANPKMILTDFPAAIGVAIVVLFTCEWLKWSERKWQYAVWAGGALGFTFMLRTNAFILLVLLPLFASIKFSKDWRKWLSLSSLMLLAVIAITLPWELRNRSLGAQMYAPIIEKFKGVIEQRYTAPDNSGSSLPQALSSLIYHNGNVLSSLYLDDHFQNGPDCNIPLCFVSEHFLHNIITSVLILPTSPVMDDLRHTVRDGYPFWRPLWDGSFTLPSLFIFLLNVFLIVLGISIAWKRTGLTGLTPIAIFLFYSLSNAFARTSGGRYVVPMDWILVIYYLLGVFQIIVWISKITGSELDLEAIPSAQNIHSPESSSSTFTKSIPILLTLLGFGLLLPLSENLYADRYKYYDPRQILTEYEQSLEITGLNVRSIESFLQNKNATILIGRALYPRHFGIDQGEAFFYPNLPLGYPRTTFNLIESTDLEGVILPGNVPGYFPHASDVLVIGCREPKYFDALIVIVLDEQGAVYARTPKSPLTCPLQQPVCDNNSTCK